MDLKNVKGNSLYITHCPGKGRDTFADVLNEGKKRSINLDAGVTIVTPATPDIIEKCPLIQQLNKSNIKFVNPMENFHGNWNMTEKLNGIARALASVTTPYVLVLDASDVVILRDIDEGFIAKFKSMGCKALYNGTTNQHPREKIERKTLTKKHAIYRYLNAGVCFGETEFLKNLYEDASVLLKYDTTRSEQYYIRKLWDYHYPDIKVDEDMDLFTCMHYDDARITKDNVVLMGKNILKFRIDITISRR